jgi:hypothetical protein
MCFHATQRKTSRDTIAERLWSRVVKTETCWVWTGNLSENGYGHISVGYASNAKVHRVSWELAHGPIASGLSVCHKCDNPACVRPDHLFLGTQADNMRDCSNKGRVCNQVGNVSEYTVCGHGHALTPTNTYANPKTGLRRCRTCHRATTNNARKARNAKARGESSHLAGLINSSTALP